MGLRNCCCSRHKGENDEDLYDEHNPESNENIKPQFRFLAKEKVLSCEFGEFYKTKRFKLKQKKRLMLTCENNYIHILSFYLGTFVFLLNSIKVEDRYQILNCGFLNRLNSKRFCVILENNEKKSEILIVKIQKISNLSPVQLDTKSNNNKTDGDILTQRKTEESSKSEYNTHNSENQNNNYQTAGNKEMSLLKEESHENNHNGQTSRLNDDNKKIMESILNSSTSSSNEEFDFPEEENTKGMNQIETVLVLRNYDTQTANSYYKTLNKKSARKHFEDVYLAKFNYYMNNIQQIIDDNNLHITNSKIENDMVYVYSDSNRTVKTYKISKSGRTYRNISVFEIVQSNPFCDLYFFPNIGGNLLVADGVHFLYYKNNTLSFRKHFKEFFHLDENQNKNLEIIKFTKMCKNPILPKFNPNLTHLLISGFCKFNNSSNEISLQFFAYVNLEKLGYENKNEMVVKSKMKIFKEIPNISEISYGPYSNGPILTGHTNGTILIWNTYSLHIMKTIRVYEGDPIVKILNEPTGVTICCAEHKIQSLNLIEKKFEFYFNENEDNELERIIVKTSNLNSK